MSEAIEPQTLSKKDLVDRVVDGDVTQHAFRTELCRTLTSDELKAYDAFLADSPKPDDSDLASFEEAMATFRQQEPARSGRPLNELMIPSGSPRSYIGLLLHYSPLPKTDMNLFDVSNPCVRILMTKGINEQTSFGWDMHWRAERTTGSGSPCPIRNYAAELKEMHDNMTKTVLERLALPWMLVGGKCAARGYKDLVKSRLRQVSVKIPGSDLTFRAGLEFALVDPASTSFGTGPRLAVHRVVAFMAHPEHVLHSRSQRNDYAASIAADPLINMILAGAKVPHTAQKAYLTGLVHAEADLPQSRPILLLPQSAQVGEAIPTQKHHTKFFNFQFCEKEEIALKRVLYPGEIESELLALVQQELGPSKYQRLLDSKKRKGTTGPPADWDMSEEAHELRKYIRDTQDKGQHWIWNGREIELTPTGTFSFFRPDGSPAFALDLGRNFVPLYHDRGLIVRFTAEEMALHAADNNQKVWLLTPQDMASFKESDLLLELWREEVEYQQMLASMDDVGRRVRFVGAARGQGLEVARNRLEGEAVEDKEPDAKRRRMVG